MYTGNELQMKLMNWSKIHLHSVYTLRVNTQAGRSRENSWETNSDTMSFSRMFETEKKAGVCKVRE